MYTQNSEKYVLQKKKQPKKWGNPDKKNTDEYYQINFQKNSYDCTPTLSATFTNKSKERNIKLYFSF